jgi:flagellar basal body-associated protein FliL
MRLSLKAAGAVRARLMSLVAMTAVRRRAQVILSVAATLLLVTTSAFAVIAAAAPAELAIDLDGPPQFRQLPEIISDLRPAGHRQRHVRVGVVLEIGDAEALVVAEREVKIVGAINDHLRRLAPADLAGEPGANNLKAAVRAIVDDIIAPQRLRGVLLSGLVTD